jgi:hypothetical protein
MLSQKSSIPSPHPAPLPTDSHFLALALPCTGVYKVCKTKEPLFPMMAELPSSATYAARDMSSGGTGFQYKEIDNSCAISQALIYLHITQSKYFCFNIQVISFIFLILTLRRLVERM